MTKEIKVLTNAQVVDPAGRDWNVVGSGENLLEAHTDLTQKALDLQHEVGNLRVKNIRSRTYQAPSFGSDHTDIPGA